MGNCGSTTVTNQPRDDLDDSNYSPLTEEEINKRIVASERTETAKFLVDNKDKKKGSYDMRFAYVSQKGYYPNQLNKANQDSYVVVRKFCNQESAALFGVFDGHGSFGDTCSIFAKHKLPQIFQDYIKKSGKNVFDLTDEELEDIYTKAFVDTNIQCHRAAFDDALSGTTAITVLVLGKRLYIANVGDSRAIICTQHMEEKGKILAEPLSIDQTPFRKDERERVKKCGARVLTIDQIEGVEPIHENWGTELGKEIDEIGDPPRLWNITLDKPGTAFTRSIGDSCAEAIGVFAEPEHLVRELHVYDKYVVIASDGVFEFLTSQTVCDMTHTFKDPLDACRKVVRESYNLWLQYEIRTDDITMIALYFDNININDEDSDRFGSPTSEVRMADRTKIQQQMTATLRTTTSSTLRDMTEHKPVRRAMSKAKRRLVMDQTRRMSQGMTIEEFPLEKFMIEKTKEETERLETLTQANFLFQHLLADQRSKLYSVFEKVKVKKGDVVIKQGDQGDKFYVVDNGNFEVSVRGDDGMMHVVMTYDEGGSSFGELSLMYGKPRAATVTATSDGVIWALARAAFKAMLMRKVSHTNLIKILKKVEILKQLPIPQLQRLCDVLAEQTFEDGDYIVKQGEKGRNFYIISSGECICTTVDSKTKAEKELQRLKTNDYFGERSLLMEEPRALNVQAVGKCSVFNLERSAFIEVVGDLHELIAFDQEKKKAMKQVQSTTTYRIAKHTIQGVNYNELDFQSFAFKYDYGFLGAYLHKRGGSLAFQTYTVKAISKKRAIESDCVDQIVQDRDLLALLSRPSTFVPVILASFTDPKCVFTVYKGIVVCQLSEILSTVDNFDEKACRFYASCVTMAVEFLHDEGIMHRRVTPECIWVTSQGYAQLADLGCAREMSGQQQFTMCGDPSYLSPEQVKTMGHNHTVDFWSLGVLIYEMLTGVLPFGDADTPETELYKNISGHTKDVDCFEKAANADAISEDAKDLVASLLYPESDQRIGSGAKGCEDIKQHPWLKDTHWKELTQGRLPAPHADICSVKTQQNISRDLEKEFVTDAEAMASEDLPEELEMF